MKASVMAAFKNFQTKFEGALNYMYTDVYGLVTTGIGNLVDNGPRRHAAGDDVGGATSAMVQGLPWKHADGSPASSSEIDAEYWSIKNAWPSVQSVAAKSIATLHLEDAAISNIVVEKAHEFEDTLRRSFPDYDNLPADAQMGLLSMSWAMGAGFAPGWPHFTQAVNSKDFSSAATQSHMNDSTNPGLVPRNAANVILFNNAAQVESAGGDPEVLYYPTSLTSPSQVQSSGGGIASSGTALKIAGILTLFSGAAAAGYFLVKNKVL